MDEKKDGNQNKKKKKKTYKFSRSNEGPQRFNQSRERWEPQKEVHKFNESKERQKQTKKTKKCLRNAQI